MNPPNIYSMIARYIKKIPPETRQEKGQGKRQSGAKAKAKAGIHEPMQAAEQEPGYAAEQEQGYTAKQGPGSAQISSETGVSGRLVSDAFASIQVPGDASAELLAGEVTVSGQYREDSPANGQVRAEIIENTQIWAEIAGSTKIGAEVIEGAQFREGISADAQPTGKSLQMHNPLENSAEHSHGENLCRHTAHGENLCRHTAHGEISADTQPMGKISADTHP